MDLQLSLFFILQHPVLYISYFLIFLDVLILFKTLFLIDNLRLGGGRGNNTYDFSQASEILPNLSKNSIYF